MRHGTRVAISLTVLAALAAGYGFFITPNVTPRAVGPVSHEAYVWQRQWDEAVQDGVRQGVRRLPVSGLTVLAAEVSFGLPMQVAAVELDYETLRQARLPIGLALRLGPYGSAQLRLHHLGDGILGWGGR